MDFYQAAQQEISTVVDFSSKSKELWVFFGGINGGLGVPIFEFGNIAKDIDVKKVFVRDRYQAFYHKGLENVDGVIDIASMKIYLKKIIEKSKADKVVFIGNSAGGFAAILFGSMLKVEAVHAFCPPTLVRRKLLPEISDKLGSDNWKIIEASEKSDLLSHLSNEKNDKTLYHIYFDEGSPDSFHAKRLENFSNVVLHTYHSGGHKLIKKLKDKGELTVILHSI